MELNYAALIAAGTDRTLKTRDGTIYQIALTGTGIRLTLAEANKASEQQMSLPGIDEG